MRTQHTTHQLPAFPVYCSAWISEDKLVLGGGGGASKTGVKNKLVGGNEGGELRDPRLSHHALAWTRSTLENPQEFERSRSGLKLTTLLLGFTETVQRGLKEAGSSYRIRV